MRGLTLLTSGRRPLSNVSVYCEPCGAETHTFATTTRIYVSLDAYTDPGGLPKPTPPNPSGPGWREVVVNGDTRFDMELVRR